MTNDQFLESTRSQSQAKQSEDREYNERMNEVLPEIEQFEFMEDSYRAEAEEYFERNQDPD